MPRTIAGVRRHPARLVAAATLLTVGLAGCGSSGPSSPAPSPSVSASAATGVLTVRDAWVKAADKGMTAAFGTLVNDGDTDVTVTAAASDVSPVELHEMVMRDGTMVMRRKSGGIVVKAHASTTLQPGGEHLMLMDLKRPVQAGDQLTFTLTFADGKTRTFTAIAKPFTGAQETYAPGTGDAPMAGMSATPRPSVSPMS